MKLKQLGVLLTALLVVTAIFLLVRPKQKPYQPYTTPFNGLNTSTKTAEAPRVRVELIKQSAKYIFEGNDGKWEAVYPFNFPADQKLLNEFVDIVKKLEVGEVISIREDKQNEYQVSQNNKRLQVMVYEGTKKEPAISFFVGKESTDYKVSFFRYSNSKEIRTCKGLYPIVIDRIFRDWLNRKIFTIKKEDVEQIKLIYPNETLLLKKNGYKWNASTPLYSITGDKSKLDAYIDTVVNFEFDDCVEQGNITDFKPYGLTEGQAKANFQLEIKSKNKTEKILIGNKADQYRYFYRKAGLPEVFIISVFRIDNRIKKILSEFK
ncbi:MAG: hypothetical protein A3J83_06815 [Elusimicrobia bacterium RIFOXYA2_FULL_40_6]|nr:MAG: hypothetical protein A3J83_06815 [Elusimicrobia bacterium RIFOXYA2_FULL_40_6]